MIQPFLIGHGEVRISSARSSNSKWIITQQPDGFVWLFTYRGDFKRVVDRNVRSDTQPVFSWTDDDSVFTVDGNQVWRNNLLTDASELIASFPQYVKLSAAHAEGDLTPDGWLALCGVPEDGSEHVFCYNVNTKESGDVYRLDEPIDGLKAAQDGWLLVSGERGIRAYPRSGASHLVAAANGHACAVVHQGKPKLVWCNAADPAYNDNAAMLIDIENPEDRKVLKSFPWAYAMHVSGEFVSVYDDPSSPVTKGLPFQIWHTPFDGSTPTPLFEWTGPYHKEYTPRASYSDGLVLFNKWNGQECNVWGLKMDGRIQASIPLPLMLPGERVDYRDYVGKKYWEFWPTEEGYLEVIEQPWRERR